MADINHCPDLILCDGGVSAGSADMKKLHGSGGEEIHSPDQRGQDNHQEMNDRGVSQRQFFRIDIRRVFRRDFAEYQNQERQDAGSQSDAPTAEKADRQRCGQ